MTLDVEVVVDGRMCGKDRERSPQFLPAGLQPLKDRERSGIWHSVINCVSFYLHCASVPLSGGGTSLPASPALAA